MGQHAVRVKSELQIASSDLGNVIQFVTIAEVGACFFPAQEIHTIPQSSPCLMTHPIIQNPSPKVIHSQRSYIIPQVYHIPDISYRRYIIFSPPTFPQKNADHGQKTEDPGEGILLGYFGVLILFLP